MEQIVVIGAGPAGLTAAYELVKCGKEVVVLEADKQVGGLARSIDLWGHRVDLGPHRFFSANSLVNNLWLEVLEDDYSSINRKTRILFDEKLYAYPLEPWDIFSKFSLQRGARAILSYGLSKLRMAGEASNLEEWLRRSFGDYLYQIFFRPYSEKLWGLPCAAIEADFARQRIRSLNLATALKSLFSRKAQKRHRTLADVFVYPSGGAGGLYETMAQRIASFGGKIHLNRKLLSLSTEGGCITELVTECGMRLKPDRVISTMPISSLLKGMSHVPDQLKSHIDALKFRSTFLVYLLVKGQDHFPDQWIYIQDGHLAVGRITNFSNWGSENKDLNTTVLCLEIWASPGESLWMKSDDELVQIAVRDLNSLKALGQFDVLDSHVHRIPKCYPVYYRGYKKDLAPIERYLDSISNLSVIGRYGAYKYNNQDHSILMGILAAQNITQNANHNLWELNSDFENYQEQKLVSSPEVNQRAANGR